MRVYLDNCCFNRPFDSLSSEIVRMEAEEKLSIQALILIEKLELVWSFILDLANVANPYEPIRNEIATWKKKAVNIIHTDSADVELAESLSRKGVKGKDAVHLACAVTAGVDYFITTDRKLIRRGNSLIEEMAIVNPIDFLTIVEGMHEE